ncbi:hypothetical protein LWI29_006594 [Acer saccharum]|uniref:Uncharacterized protein n=1 Tax=Acer saccharum TaxID=4024 RepID=A0AA39RH10_ACESA|nr:hypothetical protein LWI29_006594 [Acer saccharum]
MGALDCFSIQVENRESNLKLDLGEYVRLAEFPSDDRKAPLIKHELPDYEKIIDQLKEENRAVKAINFELAIKLEEALKGQDNLVDEFTIRVSKTEKETLKRDQLMRYKKELSIARKGKAKEVDYPLNRNLDKVKQISASSIKSKASPLQNKKDKIQMKEKPTQAPKEEISKVRKAKKRRLQRKSKEEKKAAAAIVVEEQGLDTRGELGTSTDILAPKRTTAPMRSSEPIPDWGVTLTTMVKDLTFEFRAFRDSFGSDGNYTRRTPYHPRKRTRIEGPSSFATGPDADSNENLEIAHTPPPYKPFDPTVEF